MDEYDRYVSIEEQFALMVQATEILRKIKINAQEMRYQFGEPAAFVELVAEINEAQESWIASNC